jgi:hypothetical protein
MNEFPEVKEYTGERIEAIPGTNEEKKDGIPEDGVLLKRIDNFLNTYKPNYQKLQQIAIRNREYWRAKQIDESDLYVGESPIIDNRIFTALETIVPIVTRKTPEPDITIIPFGGRNTQLQEKTEVFLKQLWETDLNMQANMEAIVRNLFAARYGSLKYFYDDKKKRLGARVQPMGKLLFNYGVESIEETAIVEFVTKRVGDVCKEFPEKAEEIKQAAGLEQMDEDSLMEYIEWWSPDGEIYACKYKDILMFKGPNPNWNWTNPFEVPEDEIDEEAEEVEDAEPATANSKSFNHLPAPEKPYLLLNHLTWGDSLVDDTSLIEQAISLQDSVNKRKRNTEQNAGMANGKIIGAGKRIKKDDFDEIDNSPEQKIYLEGAETTEGAIAMLTGRALDNGIFTDMQDSRAEIDNVMGTHATTRGEQQSQETATGRAILKESDAGRLEILTRRIEKFAQDFYNSMVQMIYVHFDEQHPIHYSSRIGNAGHLTARERQAYILRDEYKDVSVEILVQRGSTVPRDKMTQKAEAVDLAKQGLMSKKDMYEILEYSNPDDLARNAYLEANAPQMLYEIPTGDTWEIEAIRHTSEIVNSEVLDGEKVPIFDSQDPAQYAKHVTTHQEYLKGTEIDPDLPSFDELDLDVKSELIEHIQKELTQAEELANELQSQMGGISTDPTMAAAANAIAGASGAVAEEPMTQMGSGQIAAEVMAGGQAAPPPQMTPPMV